MNVDKISVTNSFRGHKFVKNAMAVAAASVAASGLYAESRRDGLIRLRLLMSITKTSLN